MKKKKNNLGLAWPGLSHTRGDPVVENVLIFTNIIFYKPRKNYKNSFGGGEGEGGGSYEEPIIKH